MKPTSRDELEIIASFLDHHMDPHVSSRGRSELSNEQRALIEKLAANDISEVEKKHLVPLLNSNEIAMEYLASLNRKNTKQSAD